MSAVRRTREVYLDIVGQLRGHQVVEFLFAQGAGGSVLPSIVLELGDDGADGGFHDGLCWGLKVKKTDNCEQSCEVKRGTVRKDKRPWSHLLRRDAVRCVVAATKKCVPPLWPPLWIYMPHLHPVMHTSAENSLTCPLHPHPAGWRYLCLISTSLGDRHEKTTKKQQKKKKKKKVPFRPTKGKIVLMVAQKKRFQSVCRARDLVTAFLSGHSNQATESCLSKQ